MFLFLDYFQVFLETCLIPLLSFASMGLQERPNPHIIGVTGSFGSGCSYVAKHIIEPSGYQYLSLSDHVLKPLFTKETGKDPKEVPRRELQQFGDTIRERERAGYLAEEIVKKIQPELESDSKCKWIVDSIRNPGEIRVFRDFSRNFFLFGIHAEKAKRWERVKGKYDNNKADFDEDDQNDTGEGNVLSGQRVGDCFYEADIVLTNEEHFQAINNKPFTDFAGEVKQYLDLVQKPLRKLQPIRKDEALMAIAYAMSQRSSCRKRKVGAIIVDREGNIVSSGYNEVPRDERPCTEEYGMCYRERLSNKFFEALKSEVPEVQPKANEVILLFRREFKILDYCRALHAEENAIINLARNGRSVPLEECVLYTTTYPCRMCANKIVSVGLRSIVYVEPYPDEVAKSILGNADVKDQFFRGVTFKAYTRLYGEER